jgi:transposase InsO family protein
MDFITGLPHTSKGYDSIWVIVDRLTKVAHFIPVNTTYKCSQLAKLYMAQIVYLHGVLKKIVSDRGSQFTSRFWKSLHDNMGTKLNFGSTYHPQTDGQTERTNQALEDMLRACVLRHGGSWDKSLPYAEFSYNNSYQASLEMSPFEALYGRKCITPLYWDQTGERQFFVGMAAGRVLFGYNNTRPEIVPETSTNIHTHQAKRARNCTRTHAHRVSTGYRVSSGYVIVD